MPNRFLVGNGRWCSCCHPEGRPSMKAGTLLQAQAPRPGCNECVGQGRIAFSAEQILAATLAAAWRHAASSRPEASRG